MNEQTAALLQGLATKLGTTSEYLWGILLKQAPIAGVMILVQYALTAVALYVIWRYREAIGTQVRDGLSSDAEVLVFIGLIVSVGVSIVWLLACLFAIESMVTAFLNPEYWALNKVLATVKSAK